MDNFTKELNELLIKYPDLGEFSIHIHPRVTIDVQKPNTLLVNKNFPDDVLKKVRSDIPQVSTEPKASVPLKELDPDMLASKLEAGVANRLKHLQVAENG